MVSHYVQKSLAVLLLYAAIGWGSMYYRSDGWLDRVVQHYKNDFIKELLDITNITIKARIEAAPPGYVDSEAWDFPSVIRLIFLIWNSEGNEEVRDALRRLLIPNRRMSYEASFKYFPSLLSNHKFKNNATIATSAPHTYSDSDIIYVSNPVESRLPGARISVRLLRKILWRRARARQYMEHTKRIKIRWKDFTGNTTLKPHNKNKSVATQADKDSTDASRHDDTQATERTTSGEAAAGTTGAGDATDTTGAEDAAQTGAAEDAAQTGAAEDAAETGAAKDTAQTGAAEDAAQTGAAEEEAQTGAAEDEAPPTEPIEP